MPRIKKSSSPDVSASEIYSSVDAQLLSTAIQRILEQGGAVMLGQTRDNSKLIVTVYLDGEQDKEYCDSVKDVVEFIGQYQV